MGARGARPKPSEIKKLEGNPGKREISNHPVYSLSDESKKPPPYLGSYGKKEWKRILPLLEKNRLMTDADYIMLAGYCQSGDTWINAEKMKRTYGFTDTTDKGNIVQRPEVGIANTALQNILKFGREFGLSPSSRAALSVEAAENSSNPVLSLIDMRKSLKNE